MKATLFWLMVALTYHIHISAHVLRFLPRNSCPSNLCPHNNTCCDTRSGYYACCPAPQATCCEDGVSCCPNGYVCSSTRPSTCIKTTLWTAKTRLKLMEARAKKMRHRIQQFITEQKRLNLARKEFVYSATGHRAEKLITNANLSKQSGGFISCGDSVCVDNHPCCNWTLLQTCCPYSNGICCKNYYCCPVDYQCDNSNNTLLYCTIFRPTSGLIQEDADGEMTSKVERAKQEPEVNISGSIPSLQLKIDQLMDAMATLATWLRKTFQRLVHK